MNGSLSLPAGLRRQFDELERRLWRIDTIIAVCGGVGSLLVSFVLLFISDRLWDTPPWMRVLCTAAGAALSGCFLFGYGRRWIWGSRSFPALATLVQRRYRRLGDRLLGIVELADETKRPANFSPALCNAAIDQVASEAARVDFRQAVGTKRPRHYLSGLAVAAGIAAAFFIFTPQAGWNALVRWVWPTMKTARYTFVSLANVPDRLVVAHGEPFEIAVGVHARSFWQPVRMSAQFERQPVINAPIRGGSALFKVPGQTMPGALTLRVGDVKRRVVIEPAFRPELRQLTARIELPAYLEHPPAETKVESGSLNVLRGSRVAFTGQISRALTDAYVEGNGAGAVKIAGDTFSTEELALDAVPEIAFAWKDYFGLESAAPSKLRIAVKEDAAPRVECDLPPALAILEEEIVRIDAAARDDFGVREIGVRWQIGAAAEQAPEPEERRLREGAPDARTLGGQWDFSPALLGIPAGSSVTVWATATDRFPARAASQSEPHQIYVLSREAHARLIQERLEKLLSQLEELARRQEALLEAGKAVRAQEPAKLADAASTKKLADQAAEQRDVAKQLEQLAEQTGETLREGARNQDLSPETLQKWAGHAQTMQELAQAGMPAAAKSLSAAQGDSAQRAGKLNEAVAQEEQALQELRDILKSSEQSLENLMAENLARRLRKIAGWEKSIVSDFAKILPETVGLRPEQLPDAPRQAVARMGGLQEQGRGESGRLQSEIMRLFERTKLERYGDVAEGMDDAKTDEALAKLTQLIQKNVTVESMESAAGWGRRFEEWADRLDEKDDTKSNPAKGDASEADMRALLALLRLRQQEETLRDQTQALERQKSESARYVEETRATAARQHEVRAALKALEEEAEFPVSPAQLRPVGLAMEDAAIELEKPDTGDPAVTAETDAINLLTEIITSQCQKCGKSGASLMAMMGLRAGGSAGGSLAGGDTDQENVRIPGTRAGEAPDAKRVEQAGGTDTAKVPAEFREAIEKYQRALEREGELP